MAQLTIPESLFQKLLQLAAKTNSTAESLATKWLDEMPMRENPEMIDHRDVTVVQRLRDFDGWIQEVRSQPCLDPMGHEVDVSRESMYAGCGE